MYFSKSIPSISIERSMAIHKLAAARSMHPDRPPWSAIFAKAFGLAAEEFKVLRQIYFKFPFSYLYEFEESMMNIAIESTVEGEPSVLVVRIRNPNKLPLNVMRSKIDEMRAGDLGRRGFYRTLAIVNRLPLFLRRPLWSLAFNVPRFRRRFFGTSAVTSVGALGADLITPIAPVTSLLTYGPLGVDGTLKVRLVFDHRVYDGATAARVLARLEELLLGPICDELQCVAAR